VHCCSILALPSIVPVNLAAGIHELAYVGAEGGAWGASQYFALHPGLYNWQTT